MTITKPGTKANRMWARIEHTRLGPDHRLVALAAAHLFDDPGARYEYVTAGALVDATGLRRPRVLIVARELHRDHLLTLERRGAAYLVTPGPALTHDKPTDGGVIVAKFGPPQGGDAA